MYKVIECKQLIDGVSDGAISDAIVGISNDGRIDYVGSASGFTPPPEAQRFEVANGTVLPGLIDSHVHITKNGHLLQKHDRAKFPPSSASSALDGLLNAQRSLVAGFTTLRDLSSPGYVDVDLKNTINAREADAARLFVCGQGLCISGGHMDRLIYPEHVSMSDRVGVCNTAEEFRTAVRKHVKMGVDFIKLNANVRFYADGEIVFQPEMSVEELEAACAEAHKFGRHVAAHTAGGPPTEDAIRAGVDTIEHARWLTDRSIELILENDAFWVPTFLTSAAQIEGGQEAGQATNDEWAHQNLAFEATFESFERAMKAGVKISAGTDCGFICDHGDNARELEFMVKAGYSAMQAIQAATRVNAELLGADDMIGTLEPGKLADVLVVDGDPLADITTLSKRDSIRHVFKEGRVVHSAA